MQSLVDLIERSCEATPGLTAANVGDAVEDAVVLSRQDVGLSWCTMGF